MRFVMEHVLEWYLVYRDEPLMTELLPEGSRDVQVYTDVTGVNVFARATVGQLAATAA
jgi:extracellular factor (EF) 3-hydroxypalmitic acid methyl ester biosynthesis protein